MAGVKGRSGGARLGTGPKKRGIFPTIDKRDNIKFKKYLTESGNFLYVIGESRDGPLKIGVSRAPVRRLIDLQVSSYRKLRTYFIFPCPSGPTWETRIHRILEDHNLGGEWFNIPIEVAMSAIWALAMAYNTLSYPRDADVIKYMKYTIGSYHPKFSRETKLSPEINIPASPDLVFSGNLFRKDTIVIFADPRPAKRKSTVSLDTNDLFHHQEDH